LINLVSISLSPIKYGDKSYPISAQSALAVVASLIFIILYPSSVILFPSSSLNLT